jgi:hypothetical protein
MATHILDMTKAAIIGTPYYWWPIDVQFVPLEAGFSTCFEFQIDEKLIVAADHQKIRDSLASVFGSDITGRPSWHKPLGINRHNLPCGAAIRKIQ